MYTLLFQKCVLHILISAWKWIRMVNDNNQVHSMRSPLLLTAYIISNKCCFLFLDEINFKWYHHYRRRTTAFPYSNGVISKHIHFFIFNYNTYHILMSLHFLMFSERSPVFNVSITIYIEWIQFYYRTDLVIKVTP